MSHKIKQHGITYTTGVARQAAADLTHFLETHFVPPRWPRTVAVHNVEADPAYQQYDIDLLWTIVQQDGRLRVLPVEIKGDRYHRTGNFFFETVSNLEKGTPGCFLYTRATWLFYYFVEIGHLYCLPMATVRPWFQTHLARFRSQQTSTPVGNGRRYITEGRLVPIQTVLSEVDGILQFRRRDRDWTQIP